MQALNTLTNNKIQYVAISYHSLPRSGGEGKESKISETTNKCIGLAQKDIFQGRR